MAGVSSLEVPTLTVGHFKMHRGLVVPLRVISGILAVQIGVCSLILLKEDLAGFVVEVDRDGVEVSLLERVVVEEPWCVILADGWSGCIENDLLIHRGVCISVGLNNLAAGWCHLKLELRLIFDGQTF